MISYRPSSLPCLGFRQLPVCTPLVIIRASAGIGESPVWSIRPLCLSTYHLTYKIKLVRLQRRTKVRTAKTTQGNSGSLCSDVIKQWKASLTAIRSGSKVLRTNRSTNSSDVHSPSRLHCIRVVKSNGIKDLYLRGHEVARRRKQKSQRGYRLPSPNLLYHYFFHYGDTMRPAY